MDLIARRSLQDRGLDLDEIALLQVAAQRRQDTPARPQERLAVGMDVGHPPRRGLRHDQLLMATS